MSVDFGLRSEIIVALWQAAMEMTCGNPHFFKSRYRLTSFSNTPRADYSFLPVVPRLNVFAATVSPLAIP
jgi:hypothetical protein